MPTIGNIRLPVLCAQHSPGTQHGQAPVVDRIRLAITLQLERHHATNFLAQRTQHLIHGSVMMVCYHRGIRLRPGIYADDFWSAYCEASMETDKGPSSVERLLDELDEIQRFRKRRQSLDRPLKLERFQPEIVRLHLAGASLADICLWLSRRRIHVARSTVRRAILRWSERSARQRAAIEAVQLDLLSHLQALDDDAQTP